VDDKVGQVDKELHQLQQADDHQSGIVDELKKERDEAVSHVVTDSPVDFYNDRKKD
jgi:hypothetical protein